jgi:hypothetical protein
MLAADPQFGREDSGDGHAPQYPGIGAPHPTGRVWRVVFHKLRRDPDESESFD